MKDYPENMYPKQDDTPETKMKLKRKRTKWRKRHYISDRSERLNGMAEYYR